MLDDAGVQREGAIAGEKSLRKKEEFGEEEEPFHRKVFSYPNDTQGQALQQSGGGSEKPPPQVVSFLGQL